MKYISTTILVILSAVMLTSCNVSTDTNPGVMQVLLTDAPANYDAVFIDIQEVRVHRSSEAEDDESGWETINSQPVQVDLLELTNGNTEILGEAELEAGTYSQIRLVLGDANEVVIDGESFPLNTPSAQQSGLKLNINAEVEAGSLYTLLLDFDASRSIVQAGASGNYNLKPVIRAANLAETGAIRGEIEPADALPWVYAIADEDTVAGTRASEDGEFLMIGLTNGTYQVSVVPAEGEYNMTVISNIEVAAPDTTDLGQIDLNAPE